MNKLFAMMSRRGWWICLLIVSSTTQGQTAEFLRQASGLVKAEFIFEKASFPQCHASTLAETDKGLVVAWFGGTREKNPDVGVWISRQTADGNWSSPQEVANGVQNKDLRYPCWNPVLYQVPGALRSWHEDDMGDGMLSIILTHAC